MSTRKNPWPRMRPLLTIAIMIAMSGLFTGCASTVGSRGAEPALTNVSETDTQARYDSVDRETQLELARKEQTGTRVASRAEDMMDNGIWAKIQGSGYMIGPDGKIVIIEQPNGMLMPLPYTYGGEAKWATNRNMESGVGVDLGFMMPYQMKVGPEGHEHYVVAVGALKVSAQEAQGASLNSDFRKARGVALAEEKTAVAQAVVAFLQVHYDGETQKIATMGQTTVAILAEGRQIMGDVVSVLSPTHAAIGAAKELIVGLDTDKDGQADEKVTLERQTPVEEGDATP